MDAAQVSELIRQTPFSTDSSKIISFFDGHERRSKRALAQSLHRIVTLSLLCFNGWLKPLLVHSGKEPVSSVQEHDPYLESLLIALHGRGREVKIKQGTIRDLASSLKKFITM